MTLSSDCVVIYAVAALHVYVWFRVGPACAKRTHLLSQECVVAAALHWQCVSNGNTMQGKRHMQERCCHVSRQFRSTKTGTSAAGAGVKKSRTHH